MHERADLREANLNGATLATPNSAGFLKVKINDLQSNHLPHH